MATENQIECTAMENREVAGERLYVEFPQKYAYIKEMSINGIAYVNTLMTGAAEESLSTPSVLPV